MEGSKQRPADLREFMSTLSTHHKLSSKEQQMLDQLVLSRDVGQFAADIAYLQDQVYELEDAATHRECKIDELEGVEDLLKVFEHRENERKWADLLDKLHRESRG